MKKIILVIIIYFLIIISGCKHIETTQESVERLEREGWIKTKQINPCSCRTFGGIPIGIRTDSENEYYFGNKGDYGFDCCSKVIVMNEKNEQIINKTFIAEGAYMGFCKSLLCNLTNNTGILHFLQDNNIRKDINLTC